jgi:hypothetical protein
MEENEGCTQSAIVIERDTQEGDPAKAGDNDQSRHPVPVQLVPWRERELCAAIQVRVCRTYGKRQNIKRERNHHTPLQEFRTAFGSDQCILQQVVAPQKITLI